MPGSAGEVKGGCSLDLSEHLGRLAAAENRTKWVGGRPVVAACVSGRRAVRLIFAGWLPQDGLFGWSAPLV